MPSQTPPSPPPAVTARGRAAWAVLALCAVALLAGWWTKARCLTDGGWQGGEQYHAWCYTDIYPLYFARDLDRAVPYLDRPVEYPVLTGAQMWLAAQAVRGLPAHRRPVAFFHATAAVGAVLLLGAVWLLSREGLPARRLAWFAAAPTLVVYAFMNWEPLPVLLLVAGIVLHRRGRDAAAGVAAGLGTAAKLFPGVLVPLVAASRWAQGRRRDAAVHVGAAAGAWAAVNVPVAVAAPEGWWRFVELNRARLADWDSLWFLAEQVRGATFAVATVNAGSAALFVVGAAAIIAGGTRLRPPDRWWELALPLLCWFLLTNKVYSPQFSLWLLPLMAVALPHGDRGARARRHAPGNRPPQAPRHPYGDRPPQAPRYPLAAPFVAFAVADLAVFALRYPFLGGVAGFEPAPGYLPFGVAVAARAAVLAWVIAACLAPRGQALPSAALLGVVPALVGRRRDRRGGRAR
jgi:uncharacterized membrane protein